MNKELLEFSNEVIDYAGGVQIFAIKNAIKIEIVSKKAPINRLIKEVGSFYSYLHNVIEKISPDKLIIIGYIKSVNSLDSPKEFHFLNTKNEIVSSTLNGIPSNSDNSPMTQMYQFQIAALNKEITKLNKDNDKLEVFKEKYQEVKQDFELQAKKNELEMEKERLKSENTLSSVLNGFKPEIQMALSGIAEKFGGGSGEGQEQQALGNPGLDPASKLGVILSTFDSLDDKLFQDFWELVVRFSNLDEEEMSEILNSLRELTVESNEELEKYKNVKNK